MDNLEQRVEHVIAECQRLREENRVLHETQEQLKAERATLQEKNELARSQIESMISRLKAMEQ
nr:TIGR02449 family protein [Halorhodospira halochloris]